MEIVAWINETSFFGRDDEGLIRRCEAQEAIGTKGVDNIAVS